MRTAKDLTKEQKVRFREYIGWNRTVSSRELANDLNVREETVAAFKANITRKREDD